MFFEGQMFPFLDFCLYIAIGIVMNWQETMLGIDIFKKKHLQCTLPSLMTRRNRHCAEPSQENWRSEGERKVWE